MAVILHYFTEFGSFGIAVFKVRNILSSKTVAQKICYSAIYDISQYSHRLLRKRALKRDLYCALNIENSTFRTLRDRQKSSFSPVTLNNRGAH